MVSLRLTTQSGRLLWGPRWWHGLLARFWGRVTGRMPVPQQPSRAGCPCHNWLTAYRGFRVVSNPHAPENQGEPLRTRAGSGWCSMGDDATMSTTTAMPLPILKAEHSYREHALVVTRGSPLPAGATPTPDG